AFRVLTEIVGQLDNFQGTMTSLISLVPESAGCPPSKQCRETWRAYTNKLNVPDIALSYVDDALITKRGTAKIVTMCEKHIPAGSQNIVDALAGRYEFWLRVDDPGRRFTIVSCLRQSQSHGTFALSGKLQTSVPRFASQRFFDESL